MTTVRYSRDELGVEVQAPWGYYQPLEEGVLEHEGRQLLYTLGSACVEVSCCGHGSWSYARVEGYLIGQEPAVPADNDKATESVEIELVEGPGQRAAIAKSLQEKYPGVRVEFR